LCDEPSRQGHDALSKVIPFAVTVGIMLAMLGLPASSRAAPIDNTKHDFSNQISNPWNTAGYKCQICHTPHYATTVGRLLWNHRLSAAAYSWNPTTTAGGTTLPTNFPAWDGPSKFCLSCHDGTVGVGDLYVNGYGSSCVVSDCLSGFYQMGPDMTGNHPVGIPYPFQNASSTYNGIATGAVVDTGTYVAEPTGVRLYNDNGGRVGSGAFPGKTGVECGSCHDPHNNANTRFLRDAKTTICQRCHAF
jgi:predicted CXXCH cytochrome family protein